MGATTGWLADWLAEHQHFIYFFFVRVRLYGTTKYYGPKLNFLNVWIDIFFLGTEAIFTNTFYAADEPT